MSFIRIRDNNVVDHLNAVVCSRPPIILDFLFKGLCVWYICLRVSYLCEYRMRVLVSVLFGYAYFIRMLLGNVLGYFLVIRD